MKVCQDSAGGSYLVGLRYVEELATNDPLERHRDSCALHLETTVG
jgi:hypothetical protein